MLELRDEDRDLLISTLLAWLDADGSANAAGAALFCHPNTVRYRLRRIEEATGRSLSAPMQLAELVTAVPGLVRTAAPRLTSPGGAGR